MFTLGRGALTVCVFDMFHNVLQIVATSISRFSEVSQDGNLVPWCDNEVAESWTFVSIDNAVTL